MAQKNTYEGSAATLSVRTVVDTFDLMRPTDYPFLKWASGGNDGKPALNNLSKAPSSDKYEWGDKDDFPRTLTLNADIAADATAMVSATAAEAGYMLKGFVLEIEDEHVLVTTKGNGTTGSIGIQRGWAGSTAAAHAAGVAIKVIGTVHTQGGDAEDDAYTSPTMFYNYFQEMSREMNFSDMRKGIEVYGEDSDPLEEETAQRMRFLYEVMSTQMWHGKRLSASDGSGKSQFGGILEFTPSANILDAQGDSLTSTMIRNGMLACVRKVGKSMVPDTIFVGPWGKIKISELYRSDPILYEAASKRTGGVVIDTVITDFGPLDVVLDPWMPENAVALVKSNTVKVGPLPQNEFRRKLLSVTGSAERHMLVGAYTVEWGGYYTRYVIKRISTTS